MTYWLWTNEDEQRAFIVDAEHHERMRDWLYLEGFLPDYNLSDESQDEAISRCQQVALRDYNIPPHDIMIRVIESHAQERD